jgi:SAM-dependent methyltransferase
MFKYLLIFISLTYFIACKQEKSSNEQDSNVNATTDSVSENKEFESLIHQFESPAREEWQQPDLILKYLGDLKGKKVADIGAGTGYFSFRIAKEADIVLAIDIDKRFLDYIEEQKQGLIGNLGKNVITRISQPNDPLIDEDDVDAVILVNTYHYIQNRVSYFKKVKRGIKSGGVLLIVDFLPGKNPVGPPNKLRIPASRVIDELKAAGFENIFLDSNSLDYQYIIKAQLD